MSLRVSLERSLAAIVESVSKLKEKASFHALPNAHVPGRIAALAVFEKVVEGGGLHQFGHPFCTCLLCFTEK